MNSILDAIRSLSLTNRVLVAVGLAAVGLWGWTWLATRWRRRAHTLYVVGDEPRFDTTTPVDAEPVAGTDDAPARHPRMQTEDADPDADAENSSGEPDSADESDAVAPAPWSEDWAGGRKLCPCCGYATDFRETHRCSLCDWDEPLTEGLEHDVVTDPDRDDVLGEARARYRETGSSLVPAERARLRGTSTPEEIELRRQLRDRLEYLRSGDRPDNSETWEKIGRLFDQLHQQQERQGLDRGPQPHT
jgi:Cysteine-rich CPCC